MNQINIKRGWVLLLVGAVITGCVSKKNPYISGIEDYIERLQLTDVLLVSDHTLPHHLNLSTGGANGEERLFIDPTIASLSAKLMANGLHTYTLNVEDMITNGEIENREVLDAAYARYDKFLRAAVEMSATIIAIHYDADFISPEEYGTNATYASADEDGSQFGYVGGIQIILDKRAASEATLKLVERIIHEDKILQQLHAVGFRIRPGYADEIRFQENQTMHIAGASKGGAFLLEIAPLDQAVRLFKTPDQVVNAIEKPLTSLAQTIRQFRNASVD